MTKQIRTIKGSFEERLNVQLGKADTSLSSRYEAMRRFLGEILSSSQLYQGVAKRDGGLKLIREYEDSMCVQTIHYKDLGLVTYSQIGKAISPSHFPNYKIDSDEETTSSELKILVPERTKLALVETEYYRFDRRKIPEIKITAVLTPSTLSRRQIVIPVIKSILGTFKINPKKLEKMIFDEIKQVETECLFESDY